MTATDRRRPLPSILTVSRPIEGYWEAHGPALAPDRRLADVFDPLDAFVAHLVLDLHAEAPDLLDLAAGATGGASTVLGLNHPKPGRVVAEASGRTAAALAGYAAGLAEGGGRLAVRPPGDDRSAAPGAGVVFLSAESVEDDLPRALGGRDDRLALVFGVGRVGECAALDALLQATGAGRGRRLWLVRELTDALADSRVAVVAPDGHPHAAHLVRRLGQLFAGNFRVLHLLEQMTTAAVRATGVDERVAATHGIALPLQNEVAAARREAEAARHEAAALRAERDRLFAMLVDRERALDALQNTLAFRTAARARRVRAGLAPDGTVRFRAYRLVIATVRRAGRPVKLLKRAARKAAGR